MATAMDLRRGRGRNGRNMLHLSATAGKLDLCRSLVEEAGFDPNSVSAQGETPILTATEADAKDGGAAIVPTVRYLIERGGDPAKPDARGRTPLHNAAEFGHVEVVRLLLSKGVPVDPIDRHGTPLHLAAFSHNDQALKLLLDHGADAGADMNFVSPTGRTVLFDVVEDGLTDFVKFLLEAGADPNIPDANGSLPIMLAATREKRELVEILLPRTKPIPSVPDWSVDGIIRAMILIQSSVPPAKEIDPNDATIFSNLSVCLLRMRQGELALKHARQCKALRPDWPKAWYREAMALSFLKEINK